MRERERERERERKRKIEKEKERERNRESYGTAIENRLPVHGDNLIVYISCENSKDKNIHRYSVRGKQVKLLERERERERERRREREREKEREIERDRERSMEQLENRLPIHGITLQLQ